MKITKAIIPAAGLGTRFLPATKAMPKEMLPIVDKPIIQYIVEEAVEAGLEDIMIVTGKGKRAIEDHFDRAWELETRLKEKGKTDSLKEVQKSSKLANIHYIRQMEPKGLGHAIWTARKFIGNEPFVVLLGDNLFLSHQSPLKLMIEVFGKYKAPIIGVQSVEKSQISKYGIVEVEPIKKRRKSEELFLIKRLIEKPKSNEITSNLAIFGRYILTPRIFEILENQKPGVAGEIQLTDALSTLNEEQKMYAFSLNGLCFDVGETMSFLKANLEFAYQREELKEELIDFQKRMIERDRDR